MEELEVGFQLQPPEPPFARDSQQPPPCDSHALSQAAAVSVPRETRQVPLKPCEPPQPEHTYRLWALAKDGHVADGLAADNLRTASRTTSAQRSKSTKSKSIYMSRRRVTV